MTWDPYSTPLANLAQPAQPPPVPPTRTAVATDEPEKRPCKHCGHTQADHMGSTCRATNGIRMGPNIVVSNLPITITIPSTGHVPEQRITGTLTCGCPAYLPKDLE